MWSVLALGVAESILNRVIDLDTITRMKLNELQGQCLRVVIDAPQLSVDVYFDQDKIRLEPTALGHATRSSIFEKRPYDPHYTVKTATATLHVKDMVALSKLLLSKDETLGNIPLQGDYHLLFALKEMISQMELDIAAHLSPWVGASLAHEIGKLQQLPKQLLKTAQSAEFMLVDYLKEDSGLFAYRWQMDDLQRHTRQLNQDIDRFEAQLQQFSQKINAIYPNQDL